MVLHVLASFASLHAAIAHRYKHTVCQHRSRQDDHSQNHPIMVFHSRTAFKTNPMAKCERTGCEDSQDKLQPHFDESTHVPKVEIRALPRERDVARTRRPEGGRDYGGSATTSGGGKARGRRWKCAVTFPMKTWRKPTSANGIGTSTTLHGQ